MPSTASPPSPSPSPTPSPETLPPTTPASKSTSAWLTLAIGSGAFAAFNGVFAKMTTTSSTHGLASAVSHALGYGSENWVIEVLIRGTCFGLNLVSNAIMWILFTRALTAATSTTRVAIMNTSSNFLVTAILGMLVFSERLPSTWWLGAALLVAGTVVIGAREGKEQKTGTAGDAAAAGDATAMGVGDGGIGQSVLVAERYMDEDEQEEEEDEQKPFRDEVTVPEISPSAEVKQLL